MNAGNIGHVKYAEQQYNQHQNVIKPGSKNENETDNFLSNLVDKYTPSVYAKDPATLEKLWNETNYMADAVRKLVASAIGREDASGQGFWAHKVRHGFKLSEADRAQAQELISEDGFFGVKQTTARIMDFAKALVGENASEHDIENMRAAVQKGFDEVAKMFGGFDKLPQVSKDTYDAIMKAFDEWLGAGAADKE